MRSRFQSLGFRLAIGFGSILLLMIGMMIYLYFQFGKMDTQYSDALDSQTQATAAAGRIAELTNKKEAAVRRYFMTDLDADYTVTEKVALDLEHAILAVRPYADSQGTEGEAVFAKLVWATSEMTRLQDQALKDWRNGNKIVAESAMRSATTMASELDKAVTAITDLQQQRGAEMLAGFAARKASLDLVMGGVSLAAVLFGLFMAISTVRRVMLPVRQVAAAARRLAEGDLTAADIKYKGRDELGEMARSVSAALVNLREALAAVATSTEQVSEAAGQLSATADQSARASQEVAGAVAEIAARAQAQDGATTQAVGAMEALQQSVAQIARGAGEQASSVHSAAGDASGVIDEMNAVSGGIKGVSEAAARAAEAADAGSRVVGETVRSIRDLQGAVQQAAEQVKALGASSQKIGEITQAITEISDQTSLLALNAAIEAARAGDAGRGFAVVADEVRKLAERSTRSAADIGDLVASIQKGIAGVISAMDGGSSRARASVGMAESLGGALSEIQQAVDSTHKGMQAIGTAVATVTESGKRMVVTVGSVAAVAEENSASAEEMAAGAEQVLNAIGEVTGGARETAAAAEEVSAAMEEMTASGEEIAASAQTLMETSRQLQELLGRFRI
jgi:methyl-accepting chemotaxis protein